MLMSRYITVKIMCNMFLWQLTKGPVLVPAMHFCESF